MKFVENVGTADKRREGGREGERADGRRFTKRYKKYWWLYDEYDISWLVRFISNAFLTDWKSKTKQSKQQKQKKERHGKMILPALNWKCIEPCRRISSDRYTDRQTYRQTYRQTHRQTDVQTDIYQTLLLSIIDIGLLNYHIII